MQREKTQKSAISLLETEKRYLNLLKDSRVSVRRDAASILAEIGTDATDDLLLVLRDPDPKVRSAAAKALGRSGQSEAIPHLLKALSDAHWLVRANAILALGKLGYPGGEIEARSILEGERHGFVLYAIACAFTE